jgi:hypothetical protein
LSPSLAATASTIVSAAGGGTKKYWTLGRSQRRFHLPPNSIQCPNANYISDGAIRALGRGGLTLVPDRYAELSLAAAPCNVTTNDTSLPPHSLQLSERMVAVHRALTNASRGKRESRSSSNFTCVLRFDSESQDASNTVFNIPQCLQRRHFLFLGASHLRDLVRVLCDYFPAFGNRFKFYKTGFKKRQSRCGAKFEVVNAFSFRMMTYNELNVALEGVQPIRFTDIVLNRGLWDGLFMNTSPAAVTQQILDVIRALWKRFGAHVVFHLYPPHAVRPPRPDDNATGDLLIAYKTERVRCCLSPARLESYRRAIYAVYYEAKAELGNDSIRMFDPFFLTASMMRPEHRRADGHHLAGSALSVVQDVFFRHLCAPESWNYPENAESIVPRSLVGSDPGEVASKPLLVCGCGNDKNHAAQSLAACKLLQCHWRDCGMLRSIMPQLPRRNDSFFLQWERHNGSDSA